MEDRSESTSHDKSRRNGFCCKDEMLLVLKQCFAPLQVFEEDRDRAGDMIIT